RGSYLNVGVCCLWDGQPYFSFDLGDRVNNMWVEFDAEEQFGRDLQPLVTAAMKEAAKLRRICSTYDSMARAFVGSIGLFMSGDPWRLLHGGIAFARAEKYRDAEKCFRRAIALKCTYDWQFELRDLQIELRSLLNSPNAFADRVSTLVSLSRAA